MHLYNWIWRTCVLVLLAMIVDRVALSILNSQPCLVSRYFEYLQSGDQFNVALCDIRGSYLWIYSIIFLVASVSSVIVLLFGRENFVYGELKLLWAVLAMIFLVTAWQLVPTAVMWR